MKQLQVNTQGSDSSRNNNKIAIRSLVLLGLAAQGAMMVRDYFLGGGGGGKNGSWSSTVEKLRAQMLEVTEAEGVSQVRAT